MQRIRGILTSTGSIQLPDGSEISLAVEGALPKWQEFIWLEPLPAGGYRWKRQRTTYTCTILRKDGARADILVSDGREVVGVLLPGGHRIGDSATFLEDYNGEYSTWAYVGPCFR
jgi:hypothetical protein